MRIILVGYGVVGKGVTTILAKRYSEKIASYGFNPKVVAIADVDGAVITHVVLALKNWKHTNKKVTHSLLTQILVTKA
jgi:homoserine dehydrogenase